MSNAGNEQKYNNNKKNNVVPMHIKNNPKLFSIEKF